MFSVLQKFEILTILMKNQRLQFKHEGRIIYQWQQSLDSMTIYIKPPPIVFQKFRKQFIKQNPGKVPPTLEVKIQNQRVTIGLQGSPPYLSHKTKGKVDMSESLWFLEGEELEIVLHKAFKGEEWSVPFQGHQINVLEKEGVSKQLLLERFQQQNPGFDFSGAEINGRVPEARTFMGGVKYN